MEAPGFEPRGLAACQGLVPRTSPPPLEMQTPPLLGAAFALGGGLFAQRLLAAGFQELVQIIHVVADDLAGLTPARSFTRGPPCLKSVLRDAKVFRRLLRRKPLGKMGSTVISTVLLLAKLRTVLLRPSALTSGTIQAARGLNCPPHSRRLCFAATSSASGANTFDIYGMTKYHSSQICYYLVLLAPRERRFIAPILMNPADVL